MRGPMRLQKGGSMKLELGPQEHRWTIGREAKKAGYAVWVRGGALLGHIYQLLQ